MTTIKKIFSFFGILQCVILLLLYLFLAVYKNDGLLIFLFFYSLFLDFYTIAKNVDYLLANNSALIMLLFLFMYGIFQSVVEKFIFGNISDIVYISTLIYATTIPSYLISWSFFKKKRYDQLYINNIKTYKNNKSYNAFLIILLFILLGYVTYFFYSIGALFNPDVLAKERSSIFEDRGQGDIVVGLLISSIFLYFIYYFEKIPSKTKILVGLLLGYYIVLQLSAGNRRDFMPMILGTYWVVVNVRKIKFSIFLFLTLLIGVSIFQYLGTVRSNIASDANNSRADNIAITLQSNEFVYPFYTLTYDVDNYQKQELKLKYGESYLYPVIFFIPRNLYPEKPYSLADQFIKRNFGSRYTMGFAYTPVTEAFVNFGYIGPFLFYLLVGLVVNAITNRKNQIVNFIFFTMILDFCRGEMGTFFYQFFFTGFFLFFLPQFFSILFLRKHYA